MGDWPQGVDQASWTALTGVQQAAQPSSSVKTAWTTLIASTDRRATLVSVSIRPVKGTVHSIRADIGVGGVGSEQVIIPDLLAIGVGNANAVHHYLFPLDIPAGSRVSARIQANTTLTGGESPVVGIQLASGGWIDALAGGGKVSTYGIVGSGGYGLDLTASATPGSFGSWAQLSAATERLHRWLAITYVSANTASIIYYTRLGVGGAGSEKVIGMRHEVATPTTLTFMISSVSYMPVTIPKGSRLAASLAADQASKTLKIAVYGA